jgi:hypothetical protein
MSFSTKNRITNTAPTPPAQPTPTCPRRPPGSAKHTPLPPPRFDSHAHRPPGSPPLMVHHRPDLIPTPIAHTAPPPPTHKGPRGATSPPSGVARERSGWPHSTPSGGLRRLWGGREPSHDAHPPRDLRLRRRPPTTRSATPAMPTLHGNRSATPKMAIKFFLVACC